MQHSANKRVQNFLQEMQVFDQPKFELLQNLRQIVMQAKPEVEERMMYGGIMFSLGEDFGGIFAYKKHVSFEFSVGAQLLDPALLLEGKGKQRRHLKITSLDEINSKNVANFVKQAVAMA